MSRFARGSSLLLVAIICSAVANSASAVEETNWQGQPKVPGDWFDAENWTNSVPTAEVIARVAANGTARVDSGLAEANVLEIGIPGYATSGTLVQTGGVVRALDVQIFRNFNGPASSYDLFGGTLYATDYLHVRDTFNWYGGQIVTAKFKPNDDFGRLNIGFDFAMDELLDGSLMGGAEMVKKNGLDLSDVGLTHGANITHGPSRVTLRMLDIGVGDSASYELNVGGELNFQRDLLVSGIAGAHFAQRGGLVRGGGGTGPSAKHLGIGDKAGGSGNYELFDGDIDVISITVGVNGIGEFHQHAGTVHSTSGINLSGPGGHGTYIMEGGRIEGFAVSVGHSDGTAHFVQSGGVVDARIGVGSNLTLPGLEFGGVYEFMDGSINTIENPSVGGALTIGSKGLFRQSGGSLLSSHVQVGGIVGTSDDARFELLAGRVEAGTFILGNSQTGETYDGTVLQFGGEIVMPKPNDAEDATVYLANGQWRQFGGSVDTSVVLLGDRDHSNALWQLNGGAMRADRIQLGTAFPNSLGRLTIDGPASLSTGILIVGENHNDSFGRFDLTSAGADVTIRDELNFGRKATFTSTAGATIHMDSADFLNHRRENSPMLGLQHLRVVFSGSDATTPTFEVASKDLGATASGLTNNFAINTLALEAFAETQLQLVNGFANQLGSVEALYVRRLEVGAGSTLDLNGINLYFLSAEIDASSTVLLNGGQLIPIRLPPLQGDTNGDFVVNLTDLNNVRNNFGGAGLGDTDGDNDVDLDDLNAVRNNFGAAAGISAVPEPSGFALLATLLLAAVTLAVRSSRVSLVRP